MAGEAHLAARQPPSHELADDVVGRPGVALANPLRPAMIDLHRRPQDWIHGSIMLTIRNVNMVRQGAQERPKGLRRENEAVIQDPGAHGEPSVLGPVVASSLTDEIVLRLEEAILEGGYPPGAPRLQHELWDGLRVRRPPLP